MPIAYKADFAQMVEEEGFSIVPSCLNEDTVERLSAALNETSDCISMRARQTTDRCG
jgi:hypothetical protein